MLDPKTPDWQTLELPTTWPDQMVSGSFAGIFKLITHIWKKRQPVKLVADTPFTEQIPKYILQEFHHLPNGNYSNTLSKGYITGFDKVMMGHMTQLREKIAQALRHCQSVLDLGTGGGKTAAAIQQHNQGEVWGLDPSPYMLQHAARSFPEVKFIPGVAEALPFAEQRFDGISACFLFHELPPRYAEQALDEISRVLKSNGYLIIGEPSESQLNLGYFKVLKRYGWKGPYFRFLANKVHEPFIRSWHQFPLEEELDKRNMVLEKVEECFPSKLFYIRKKSG